MNLTVDIFLRVYIVTLMKRFLNRGINVLAPADVHYVRL